MPYSRILLIKLRHHGDVLLTTPLAHILQTSFPNCRIDFLLYAGTEDLLKNNPDVHRIWSWPRGLRGGRLLKKVFNLLMELKSQKYDLVIHLSDQMQGALLAKFLGAQRSIGLDYPKRRHYYWRACFSELAPFFPSNTRHNVEQNLAPLRLLGLHPPLTFSSARLMVSREDEEFITQWLEQKKITAPYLLIHPTARWFFKCWEEDRFAALIMHFANKGWPIVLTSAPSLSEEKMAKRILDQVSSPHVYSLAGHLTLGQLAAALQKAHLFIGVDSAPMHMAAALKKKVVALFGPSKVKEWHPWMTEYRLLQASDYGPLLDPDSIETQTKERYLSNIPLEAVIGAVEEMLTSKEETF